MYKSIIKPLLFKKQAEAAHHFTFTWIKWLFTLPGIKSLIINYFNYNHPSLEREVFGLKFSNPIGLAAGFDKDAKLIDEMAMLGFGFIEIGTLTPKPQDGNPKPRLFRLPEDGALINRMGFNNGGVMAAIERLKQRKSKVLVGGNIGKNKLTPNEDATKDYLVCLEALYPYVDYFVVNVSSPNTPNLRALQEKEPLKKLLEEVKTEVGKLGPHKPILLKIAPDLTDGQLDDIIEISKQTKIDGIIATNTSIDRNILKTDKKVLKEIGAGGISGRVLKNRSNEVIRYLSKGLGNGFPIIGVGGVFTAKDAIEKLQAGASLVQVYTGMIYEGPGIVKKINQGIVRHLSK